MTDTEVVREPEGGHPTGNQPGRGGPPPTAFIPTVTELAGDLDLGGIQAELAEVEARLSAVLDGGPASMCHTLDEWAESCSVPVLAGVLGDRIGWQCTLCDGYATVEYPTLVGFAELVGLAAAHAVEHRPESEGAHIREPGSCHRCKAERHDIGRITARCVPCDREVKEKFGSSHMSEDA